MGRFTFAFIRNCFHYSSGLVGGKNPECLRYFKVLNEQLSLYANLGIVGLDGYFRCHGVDNSPDVFAGDRAYFKAALARRGFVAGGYLISRSTGKPVITFALPVTNNEGKITAVAFAGVDLAELSKAMENISSAFVKGTPNDGG